MFNIKRSLAVKTNGFRTLDLAAIGLLLVSSAVVAQETDSTDQNLSDPTIPLNYRTGKVAEKSLSLNSILFSEGRKLAVINGNHYVENEKIGNLRVLEIGKDSVEIFYNGQKKMLTLHKNIRKK